MPKGTKVHRMKEALEREGFSEVSAIKIAQKKTGLSYQTGKPPKKSWMKRRGNRKQ